MGWAGTNRLTARSAKAGSLRLTGSLTARAPGGMVTEGRPPKVRALAEARSISLPVVRSAMLPALMVRGSRPNSLERMMRTREPPRETWTISRKVVSAAPNLALGLGSATGEVAQVPTQWSGGAAAAAFSLMLERQKSARAMSGRVLTRWFMTVLGSMGFAGLSYRLTAVSRLCGRCSIVARLLYEAQTRDLNAL